MNSKPLFLRLVLSFFIVIFACKSKRPLEKESSKSEMTDDSIEVPPLDSTAIKQAINRSLEEKLLPQYKNEIKNTKKKNK